MDKALTDNQRQIIAERITSEMQVLHLLVCLVALRGLTVSKEALAGMQARIGLPHPHLVMAVVKKAIRTGIECIDEMLLALTPEDNERYPESPVAILDLWFEVKGWELLPNETAALDDIKALSDAMGEYLDGNTEVEIPERRYFGPDIVICTVDGDDDEDCDVFEEEYDDAYDQDYDEEEGDEA